MTRHTFRCIEGHTEGMPVRMVIAGARAERRQHERAAPAVRRRARLDSPRADARATWPRPHVRHSALSAAERGGRFQPAVHRDVRLPADVRARHPGFDRLRPGKRPGRTAHGRSEVLVDVPAGQVRARYRMEGGKVGSVRFTNVPSFLLLRDLTVSCRQGELRLDIAYGGNFYLSSSRNRTTPVASTSARSNCWSGGAKCAANQPRVHRGPSAGPEHPRRAALHGPAAPGGGLRRRSVVIAGDSLVDRSPCGTGTSARVAQRHARGCWRPARCSATKA